MKMVIVLVIGLMVISACGGSTAEAPETTIDVQATIDAGIAKGLKENQNPKATPTPTATLIPTPTPTPSPLRPNPTSTPTPIPTPRPAATPTPAPQISATLTEVSDGVIKAVEIISEFDNNSTGASLKYANKDISVSGLIKDISTTFAGIPYITIGTSGYTENYVYCTIANPSQVQGLIEGTPITVSGTFSEYDSIWYIKLNPCSID